VPVKRADEKTAPPHARAWAVKQFRCARQRCSRAAFSTGSIPPDQHPLRQKWGEAPPGGQAPRRCTQRREKEKEKKQPGFSNGENYPATNSSAENIRAQQNDLKTGRKA